MISNDKIAFLMQLIMSSKESIIVLEQALRIEDEKRVEQIKKNLTKLNKSIQKIIADLKR